jgi:hypothetical protein
LNKEVTLSLVVSCFVLLLAVAIALLLFVSRAGPSSSLALGVKKQTCANKGGCNDTLCRETLLLAHLVSRSLSSHNERTKANPTFHEEEESVLAAE